MLNSKGWQAVALLSVIVPMSLLATFKLTGLIGQAQTVSETKTLDVVTWERERPKYWIRLSDTINSSYADQELSLNCSIFVYSYADSWTGYITFWTNITASFLGGFATDLNVTFAESYAQSFIAFSDDLIDPPYSSDLRLTNMSFTGYSNHLSSDLKAFTQFTSVGKPNNVNVWINGIEWYFQSPWNRSHSMDLAIALTYFNGSAYKRVVQPFLLKMIGDNNNDFETAMELHEGVYSNLYLDELDCYKIYANVGQNLRMHIYATPADPSDPWASFEINVYDPDLNVVLRGEAGHSSTIEVTSNSTGYWYVELQMKMAGLYTMEVTG